MKIAILTHPLINNYGGVLQAYALQEYLRQLGHEVIVLNRLPNRSCFKQFVIDILTFIGFPRFIRQKKKIAELTRFIKSHINMSAPIRSTETLTNYCKKCCFDAVIVGSDQVWRHDFIKGYNYNHFLSFIPQDTNIIKIAYGASFGLSDWEYNTAETELFRKSIQYFKAISVREDFAVDLCRENLNIEVQHVLDPTLLFDSTKYDTLASPRFISDKYVFVYWLGEIISLNNILPDYEKQGFKIIVQTLRDCRVQMALEDWLSYIKYADYVITDSFHGCVFSIIYRKQFFVHSNKLGGNGRLSSLMKMLGLYDNLASGENQIIDYDIVEKKLTEQRIHSSEFLTEALRK